MICKAFFVPKEKTRTFTTIGSIPLRVATSELTGFFIDQGMVKGLTFDGKAYVITHTMEQLEKDLNPRDYYYINRQFILQHNSIKRINYYFNGKLKIKTEPQFEDDLIVSKAKASDFKKWLNQ
jgi:two-component system LytT family response regulator